MNFVFIFFSLILLFSKPIKTEKCEMTYHNFFLLPLKNEDRSHMQGLIKYDYLLILKTEPLGKDRYHLILSVSFPVNVNIDLSDEILYSFVSMEKFCLRDVTKEKGRYVNILGTISDHVTKNKILENIWVKIDKVLMFNEIDNERKLNYYLLTNYKDTDNDYKKYFLMKKMYNGNNQIFQIVRTLMRKEKDKQGPNDNFECKNELKEEIELKFGDEISILGTDVKLRENFDYNAYAKDNKYILYELKNLICLIYKFDDYEELC